MPRLIKFLLALFLWPLLFSSNILASDPCSNIGVACSTDPTFIREGAADVKLICLGPRLPFDYRVKFPRSWWFDAYSTPATVLQFTKPDGTVTSRVEFTINRAGGKLDKGEHNVLLEQQVGLTWGEYCRDIKYNVGFDGRSCQISIYPANPTDAERISITANRAPQGNYPVYLVNNPNRQLGNLVVGPNGTGTVTLPAQLPQSSQLVLQTKDLTISPQAPGFFCNTQITIRASAGTTPRPLLTPAPTLAPGQPTHTPPPPFLVGANITAAGIPCDTITGATPIPGAVIPPGQSGVLTAIGCVPTEPSALVNGLLKVLTAAGGGTALLIMALGAFQMITSAGNPETLKKGQEQFTNAIIGLLFIIFAVLLLEIIGVDILGIPGFGR